MSKTSGRIFTTTLLASFLLLSVAYAQTVYRNPEYATVVQKTAALTEEQNSRELALKQELNIINVTWEDTGRAQNSSLGPNISDMTIQAHLITDKGLTEPVAMPVIRTPNFADKTGDVSPNDFYLMVGNEKGEDLRPITLTEYLDNFREYLSLPKSWKGNESSLLAARDTHVLVSPQATILPVPKEGKASFNPVLFNYQSYEKNPAVLSIIATREGTSATIIDNKRDSFDRGVGQRLFFNKKGKKASFTAMRADEYQGDTEAEGVSVGDQAGLNLVLLIQVPLVHQEREIFAFNSMPAAAMGMKSMRAMESSPTLVNAVIGHSPIEGPFVEIDNLEIVRDERFPIRVTVQFYKASAGEALTPADFSTIKKELDKVYAQADYVGSLVLDGKTGRPTEHEVPFVEPQWWKQFWRVYEKESGHAQKASIEKIKSVYGKNWPRWCSSEKKLKSTLAFLWTPKKS